jgi:hypothetical protein
MRVWIGPATSDESIVGGWTVGQAASLGNQQNSLRDQIGWIPTLHADRHDSSSAPAGVLSFIMHGADVSIGVFLYKEVRDKLLAPYHT